MAKQRQKIEQIQEIAQNTFGYECLRPEQQEVIEAILAGHDTLASIYLIISASL